MGEIYYNKFFEGKEKGSTFDQNPMLSNLTQSTMWKDKEKFYFLPYLVNCYKFTKKNKLPRFALVCSPTFVFHRDRLNQRSFMETIHKNFLDMMETCGLLDEPIMLLVEKRFHIERPIQGGSQQLYNMLWDTDIDPKAQKCPFIIPGSSEGSGWDVNPGMPLYGGLDLSRRTLWFIDDLNLLCERYDLSGDEHYPEVLDLSEIPEERQKLYKPREFYFKVFVPKDIPPEPIEVVSSESWLDGDSTETDFDYDSTQSGMLDSTLDFDEDDKEMNKIISFFANIPKVTDMVQGMLDMMGALTRILPLVITKLDDSEQNKKLKKALASTVDLLDRGIGKVVRICGFLGIKVDKKKGCAVQQIVKDRFKKNKRDFIEYEIDELNKAVDVLKNIDEEREMKPVHPGDLPPDLEPNNLYPQRMPLNRPHIHLADEWSTKPHIEQLPVHPYECKPHWEKDGKSRDVGGHAVWASNPGDMDKRWEDERKQIPSVPPED